MRHLLYVAILGAGIFGASAGFANESIQVAAYMGPKATQATSHLRGDDGRLSRFERANTIGAQKYILIPVHSKAGMKKFTRTLKVSDLQRQLNAQGAGLVVDGIWGPKTSAAVSQFQRMNELPVTGQVDAVTFDIISNNL